jgi:hypothetical protein
VRWSVPVNRDRHGTAGASDLTPHWLKKGDSAKADTRTWPRAAPMQAAPAVKGSCFTPAPLVLQPGQLPNYRAIKPSSRGAAVVGVTVEGVHKATLEEQGSNGLVPEGMEDDPFFCPLPRHAGLRSIGTGRPQSHFCPWPRLGLHHQQRRPHPDQRARRCEAKDVTVKPSS